MAVVPPRNRRDLPPFLPPQIDEDSLRASRRKLGLISGQLRNRQVAIRHAWVRAGPDPDVLPTAGLLAAGAGKFGVPFRLHLLLLWTCGASPAEGARAARAGADVQPHTTDRLQQEDLGELIAHPGPRRRSNALIRKAVTTYLAREEQPLVSVAGGDGGVGWRLGLLDETGTGKAYRNPGQAAKAAKAAGEDGQHHWHFKLPPTLFSNGWWSTLPIPALHLLTWLYSFENLRRTPGSTARLNAGVARHDDTYATARRLLVKWRLAEQSTTRVGKHIRYDLDLCPQTIDAFDAPLSRPPASRMSRRQMERWVEADPQRRMPQRRTAPPRPVDSEDPDS